MTDKCREAVLVIATVILMFIMCIILPHSIVIFLLYAHRDDESSTKRKKFLELDLHVRKDSPLFFTCMYISMFILLLIL